MKRLLYFLLALVFISVNLFCHSLMSNKQLLDILYKSNQMMRIDYSKAELDFTNSELIVNLVEFSDEKNINISQYNFLSESDLNIYSTNIVNDPNINLVSGKVSKGNTYISNKELDSSNANQTGVFSFPLSSWNVNIYDIQEVYNVGLGDEFYLSGANDDDIENFIKTFSRYGKVSQISEDINGLILINMPLLMVVAFSFVMFLVGMFYFLIQNRKEILLRVLWGHSKWLVLITVPKLLLRFLIYTVSVLFLGVLVFIVLFNQMYFLTDYIIMFVLANGATVLILLFFTLIEILSIRSLNNSSINIKGKRPFAQIQWISGVLKAIVSTILFGVISSSLIHYIYLSNKLEGLEYWNQTKNVFRMQVGPLPEDTMDNLQLDRDLNNRLFDFYKEIELKNQAFLMNSENFNLINNGNGEPVYSYILNTTDENEIYSSNGRSVTINKNYLKVNPINSSDGVSITDQLQINEDILNILVPEQYVDLEHKIINSYKDEFYFQKVSVDNIYNQALGYRINEKSIDELTVNVIYTKRGQDYFTFNSNTGDYQNKIRDPIAVIYNDSVDTSNIGANATTSLFILDKTKGNAFKNILPSLKKANVQEINNVVSIYSEANDQIIQLKWLLFQQVIGLLIAIIFSGVLLIAFIWSYYHSHIYDLNLKYLFGYSYWKRNKKIILVTIISNIIPGLLMYLIYNISILVLIIGLVLIIDLIVINVLNLYLHKKNLSKVIKGDHI